MKYKVEISKFRESTVTVFFDGEEIDKDIINSFRSRSTDSMQVLSELVQSFQGKYNVEIYQQQPKEYTKLKYQKLGE